MSVAISFQKWRAREDKKKEALSEVDSGEKKKKHLKTLLSTERMISVSLVLGSTQYNCYTVVTNDAAAAAAATLYSCKLLLVMQIVVRLSSRSFHAHQVTSPSIVGLFMSMRDARAVSAPSAMTPG